MVNTLRRFSKPIMLVITVLVIVSFTVWGPNMVSSGGGGTVAYLYGKPVTMELWQRQVRKFAIYAQLGGSYAASLNPEGLRGGKPTGLGVARSIVFENEADNLGIVATDDEKGRILLELPAFQDENGRFSKEMFEMFVKQQLNPNGYSKEGISEFLAGEARMRKVRALINATVTVPKGQGEEYISRRLLKVEASYVELKEADFAKEVTVTDEEIKKDFEERKDQFMTPAERKVRYAAFLLPHTDKPETEEKHADGLQEAANKAFAFSEALEKEGANFEELAKQFGGTVHTTEEFFDLDNPPDELEQNPGVARAAFALTKEKPYSSHLAREQGLEKGAYVLAYGEEKAPEPVPFESVKQQIKNDLMAVKATQQMMAKAREIRTKIVDAEKAGKTFYEAAESVGYKPVPVPVFGGKTPLKRGEKYAATIYEETGKLAPGQISEPKVIGDIALLVHLDQRIAGEASDLTEEERNSLKERLEQEIQFYTFGEWLDARSRAAGVNPQVFQ